MHILAKKQRMPEARNPRVKMYEARPNISTRSPDRYAPKSPVAL
jgi:hypothetical protein